MAEDNKVSDFFREDEDEDPTVRSQSEDVDGYPEGTHPVRAPSEQTYSPDRFTYHDAPDKPDPSTVAQVQEVAEVDEVREG